MDLAFHHCTCRRAAAKAAARRPATWVCAALILIWAAGGNLRAENAAAPYLIEVWQSEHGLPENIVNAIAQTPDGYLWCGTTHGLARFDGVRFKVFNARNTPELGSARIRQLYVDRRGALWATTFEGGLICRWNGRFTAHAPPPRESMGRTIIRVAEALDGALWLTVEDGAVFRFAGGKFTLVSERWTLPRPAFYQVYQDAQGALWATTASELTRIEGEALVPVLQGRPPQDEFLCPSRTGGWWLRRAGRLQLWQAEDGRITDAGEWAPLDRRVESCLEDRQGRLWVATLGQGIFCYATNAPRRQITTADGLGSDLARALFEDAEDNLWVGTRPGGLNRLRPALFKSYSRKDGLASDLVTAICEGRDGELWVGTDGDGVNRLAGNRVDHFGREQGLDARHIRTLLFDRQGDLWAGAYPGGLYRFEADRFVPVRNFPDRSTVLMSLFEDRRNRLWLGQRTLNRLVRLENGVPHSVSLPNPAPSLDVISMAEDAGGALWIGTDGHGLFRWKDGETRRLTRADGLPSDTIRALHADVDGTLWIGTLDGGLCRWKDNRAATCTTADGLVDDVINHIADDGFGNLWFSSFRGIFRASRAELNAFAEGRRSRVQCVAYGKSDGLPALECPGSFQPAGCRTRDGRLWFPTIKGLVVVDPANAPSPSIAPRVWIEEVLVDGVPLSINDAGHPGDGSLPAGAAPLRIRPGRHRYEFHYTGLNFSAPERVRFRCRLEGVEEDWVEADALRVANYSHLPPGEYRFHVTACNQAGVWNDPGATLAFVVQPHVWQTWWFQAAGLALAALFLGGSVFLAVRRKWRRQLERVEMQLSVERERARIAQDIHDGVGANLTEIAWLAEVAEKEALNPEEVRAQARKISGTARETVQAFDEIVWAVLPQNDTLSSLVEYLGRRVDELFENTPTRCWFSAPPDLPAVVVPAEVRHSFYLACKEALHNVTRHAGATEVRVRVAVADGCLRVEIEDNGRGFDPASARAGGNGLRNMRRRFAALGGAFDLDSRPGQGTRTAMVLPLRARPANSPPAGA